MKLVLSDVTEGVSKGATSILGLMIRGPVQLVLNAILSVALPRLLLYGSYKLIVYYLHRRRRTAAAKRDRPPQLPSSAPPKTTKMDVAPSTSEGYELQEMSPTYAVPRSRWSRKLEKKKSSKL